MDRHAGNLLRTEMNLTSGSKILMGMLASGFCPSAARADERRFTYSYEPETTPQGELEFEQWVTLRTQRTTGGEVKQQNFNRWELREELEYGVTDNYSVSLYLNTAAESFRDFSKSPPADTSKFDFTGISIENRYMVLNPAEHALGLTLYLEPRDHNELPDYRNWENTALFLGPVVSYRQEKWWAALTVLPQIYGLNFGGNPDANRQLDLEGHERVNIRLIIGISF